MKLQINLKTIIQLSKPMSNWQSWGLSFKANLHYKFAHYMIVP